MTMLLSMQAHAINIHLSNLISIQGEKILIYENGKFHVELFLVNVEVALDRQR